MWQKFRNIVEVCFMFFLEEKGYQKDVIIVLYKRYFSDSGLGGYNLIFLIMLLQ